MVARNSHVSMDTIRVTGPGSHAVEVWNIDGLTIKQVLARNVGECGLLIQASTNARVGLVDGDSVAPGTGYATIRMANNNGQLGDGSCRTNVFMDRIVADGGGRGIFCVSQSGGTEIGSINLSNNGSAILIENCHGVNIRDRYVNGGGEVRLTARTEFSNNRDNSITARVNGNSVREQPCGQNINFGVSGNAVVKCLLIAEKPMCARVYIYEISEKQMCY